MGNELREWQTVTFVQDAWYSEGLVIGSEIVAAYSDLEGESLANHLLR